MYLAPLVVAQEMNWKWRLASLSKDVKKTNSAALPKPLYHS